MSNSAFFTEIGAIGGQVSAELAGELGISLTLSNEGGASVTLNGYVKSSNVTAEVLARIMTAGERIEFFIPAQTGFPPAAGVSIFGQVAWIPPITGVAINLTVEGFKDISSFGTMFSLTCYYPHARQAGEIG